MLKAYLYQTSKCFFKQKRNVVLTILAVLFVALMIFVTGLMGAEKFATRDNNLVAAGVSLVSIIVFDFAIMGISSGQLLFTNPDVNFYMAGPFTRKFNLIIPITTSIKTALYFIFVIACQGALFSSMFGFRSIDMLFMLAAGFVAMTLGNIISQLIIAWLHDNKTVKKVIEFALIAFHVAWLGSVFYALVSEAGSVSGIASLGSVKIITTLGGSIFLKIIPVGGWLSFIADGIYLGSMVKLILGIVLLIAALAIIMIMFNVANFDYYEEGIASAQKMADRLAAKSAGVEEMAADVSKIKVRDGSFGSASGASVFFFKHLIENTRFSKVFFANKTLLLYKVIALAYALFMMKTNGGTVGSISGLFMMLFFDITAFAGGKSVLELNRPYFYLIPEKMSKKLFYNILGSLPEIIFNAVLAVLVVMGMNMFKADVSLCVAAFALTVLIDLLSLLISNIVVTLIGTIGKTPLLLIRQFIIIGLIGAAAVVGLIFKLIMGVKLAAFLFVMSGALAVFVLIALIVASAVIGRKELV